jgi:VIT1/CCC1 family predicted Fe2+/Mn2+ transporter
MKKTVCPKCKKELESRQIFRQSISLARWSLYGSHCPKCGRQIINKRALILSTIIGVIIGGGLELLLLVFFVYYVGTVSVPIIYPFLVGIIALFVTLTVYSWIFIRVGKVEKR